MRFQCAGCGQWHDSIPAWGWRIPFLYYAIPESERARRCYLTDDLCVVDDKHFLITGLLEIPVIGSSDVVSLGVWVSVARADWFEYQDLIGQKHRRHFGPYKGKLDSTIPTYPDSYELPVSIEVRDDELRPIVHVLSCDNPIFSEQEYGMDTKRLSQLYDFFEHRHGDT